MIHCDEITVQLWGLPSFLSPSLNFIYIYPKKKVIPYDIIIRGK